MIAACLFALLGAIAPQVEALRAEIIPQVPAGVVCQWVDIESGGDAYAVSHTEDRGVLQISQRYESYFVARFWDKPSGFDVFTPLDNIRLAFLYYAHLHQHWEQRVGAGAMWYAFASYNAGARNIPAGAGYANAITAVYIALQVEAQEPTHTIAWHPTPLPHGGVGTGAGLVLVYYKDTRGGQNGKVTVAG